MNVNDIQPVHLGDDIEFHAWNEWLATEEGVRAFSHVLGERDMLVARIAFCAGFYSRKPKGIQAYRDKVN